MVPYFQCAHLERSGQTIELALLKTGLRPSGKCLCYLERFRRDVRVWREHEKPVYVAKVKGHGRRACFWKKTAFMFGPYWHGGAFNRTSWVRWFDRDRPMVRGYAESGRSATIPTWE